MVAILVDVNTERARLQGGKEESQKSQSSMNSPPAHMPDRHRSDSLHQAVDAKRRRVNVTPPSLREMSKCTLPRHRRFDRAAAAPGRGFPGGLRKESP